MKFNGLGKLAFALAFTTTQGLAQAGTISFNEATCQSGTATSNGLTCSTSASGTSYSATLSGWSAQTGSKFVNASMVHYANYGLGMTSPGETTVSPEHAIDNHGPTEAILINFSSPNFALNQLSIGWLSGDADVSILRYTGTQAPVLGSRTVANLTSAAGWEWVGDYSTLSASAKTLNFNNTGTVKTASWWLVSAYDAGYSGKAATGALTDDNDYFKLSGFGGSIVTPPGPTTDVPEPGTFALFAVALAGFATARRKSNAK